ncbi:MAG: sugar phosphate isomerase/epimerase family protein [Haloarculaceae archaeon]
MRPALSTLGCPGWDLERICAGGSDAGFEGVDFRGYRDELDVTRHPLFTERADATRDRLADTGLTVCCLSSSIALADADHREETLSEARRLVSVAEDFGVDRVRVFGGGADSDASTAALARAAGETVRDVLAVDGAEGLQWLVETHDVWTGSRDCLTLLDELPAANTGLVWDVAHTVRLADESPVATLDALGDRIEHVHLKDAAPAPDHPDATADGYVYVLPGVGEIPVADAVRELDARGYDGWAVFEHEKRWHPSLADPAEAFPAFVDWFRSVE